MSPGHAQYVDISTAISVRLISKWYMFVFSSEIFLYTFEIFFSKSEIFLHGFEKKFSKKVP